MIDIIFPVKESSKDFVDTLLSIYEQAYHEFRVIIVKPFSDLPREVEFILEDKRFIVIDEGPDAIGVYEAMNLGLEYCSSQFVYFIGAGDRFIDRSSLACVALELDKKKEVDCFVFRVVMSDGTVFPRSYYSATSLLRGTMCCHQGTFIRTRVVKRLGGFREKYRIVADFDQLVRLVRSGYRLKSFDEAIAFYKGGGLSNNGSLLGLFCVLFSNGYYIQGIVMLIRETLARFKRYAF